VIVLGIDSATPVMSVAVVDGERVVAESEGAIARRGADLLVVVDAACRAAGVAPRELDAIAIGAGPGSFTGLRIGMATAKGIAFAAGRPLWAVSSLAALARAAGGAGIVVAALDARRGELYAGAYRCGEGRVEAIGEERVIAPGELRAFAEAAGAARFVGDAGGAYPQLAELGWIHATPRGVHVAALALGGARADITVGGAPTYIRASEAEVKYPDGVPGALRTR
jgi:tRNA threonylcarbamoyladenosine biosynthesis protein TsaB